LHPDQIDHGPFRLRLAAKVKYDGHRPWLERDGDHVRLITREAELI
jgi:ATP-dependent DNA ligase